VKILILRWCFCSSSRWQRRCGAAGPWRRRGTARPSRAGGAGSRLGLRLGFRAAGWEAEGAGEGQGRR